MTRYHVCIVCVHAFYFCSSGANTSLSFSHTRRRIIWNKSAGAWLGREAYFAPNMNSCPCSLLSAVLHHFFQKRHTPHMGKCCFTSQISQPCPHPHKPPHNHQNHPGRCWPFDVWNGVTTLIALYNQMVDTQCRGNTCPHGPT